MEINLTNVKLNGFEIEAIGANAFGSKKNITKLTLPDTVKVIDANAFINCFSDNAESIICDDFKIIDLGSCGVIMSYEGKYTEVTIPSHYYVSDGQVKKNILTINSNAFMSDNAKNITYIKISYGIQSIGENSFAKCEKLSGVSIPKSVVDSSNAFKEINNNVINDENSKFQFVYLDDRKETIEIVGYNGEDKNLIIPNQIQYDGKERKVVSVRREAFLGQNNIEKVIINNKNINIGNNAFIGTNIKEYYCNNLIYEKVDNGYNVIGYTGTEANVEITGIKGQKIVNISKEAFKGNENIKSLNIKADIIGIEESAFENCINLINVAVKEENNNVSIKANAFKNCNKELKVDNLVSNKIDKDAFDEGIIKDNGTTSGETTGDKPGQTTQGETGDKSSSRLSFAISVLSLAGIMGLRKNKKK